MFSQTPRLLVVRREAREKLFSPLTDGFDLDLATSGENALARLQERPADVALIDSELDAPSAGDLVRALKREHPGLEIVLIGAAPPQLASVSGVVSLPATPALLRHTVERVLNHRNLRIEAEQLRRQLREHSAGGLGALMGTSHAMQRVYQSVHAAAATRAPWLVCGENGVGKRVLARLVHASSARAAGPLIWFRVSGDDDRAYERLLGESGALVAANGGTLVVEHVSTLPHSLQLGLLHALEHKRIERGALAPREIDVRIIATETRDPAREVQSGRLRDTLYERLRAVEVTMPPLRERNHDVLLLAEHFLRRFAEEHQRLVSGFTPRARTKLASHNWPSNVRGLEQIIETAILLSQGNLLDAKDLGFEVDVRSPDEPRIPGSTMADIEKHAILQTLDSVAGSTARAAEILDVSVRTIQYRLNEYGIAPRRKESRPPRA